MRTKIVIALLAIALLVMYQTKTRADIGTSLQTFIVADTVTANSFDVTWAQLGKLPGLVSAADSNYVRTVEVSGIVQLDYNERFSIGVKINDDGEADSLTADSMDVTWDEMRTYIRGTFKTRLPFTLMFTDTLTGGSTDTIWVAAAQLGAPQIEFENIFIKVSQEAISGQ